ncbi:hypothetical protein CHS0354_026054 [Potamilus streckersoni]|uniref:C1q domain-containing protein n=1 Tax=Potamilus streckersoni TaxID=2493646 RepID=A0AAE0SGM2_9BIVA|nr:hypothetical protein CHS0354_026054 [Potamilus streckersoni]
MTLIHLGTLMVLTLILFSIAVRSVSPGDLLSDSDLQDNINTNDEDLEDYRRKVVDPQGSWLTFVRHSKTTNTNKKQPRRNRRKNKKQRTLVGPEGPRGPPGPPGPPGPFVSKEELLEEFAVLIKETSERRAKEIVSSMWPSCAEALTYNTSNSVPDVIGSVAMVPRLATGFNMRLDGNIHVTKRIFMELNNFKQPFQAGAFQRGDVFNAKEGRFLAPKDGIYYFSANLHIRVKIRRKEKKNMRGNDHLKIIICIDSLCQKYASIEAIAGLLTNSKVFTVTTSGILQLRENQYVSVYMDNASSISIMVLAGSEFTGALLGV